MRYIKHFKELSKNDPHIAGGKGASLGEMTNKGFPVPPGFVVLADAFTLFIQENYLTEKIDNILDIVDHEDQESINNASEKIKRTILKGDIPIGLKKEIIISFNNLDSEFVAVRSSATAEDAADNAWAGQLDSFLNTRKEDLLLNIKRCWASLFTPRAIFYRFEKKLHGEHIAVAVVVQKMINSDVSGVAFSVHPVTKNRNHSVIEACFGLGEAIVSGQVTPDSYIINKSEDFIEKITVAEQEKAMKRSKQGQNIWTDIKNKKVQKISGRRIMELAHLINSIEDHYGFPCDIEWAFEEGNFYITQSRPITTLEENND